MSTSDEASYLNGLARAVVFEAKKHQLMQEKGITSDQLEQAEYTEINRRIPGIFRTNQYAQWGAGIPDTAQAELNDAKKYLKQHGIQEPRMDTGETLDQLEEQVKKAKPAAAMPAPDREEEKKKGSPLPHGADAKPIGSVVASGGDMPLENEKARGYSKDETHIKKVVQAQKDLLALGISVGERGADGKFGPATEEAVRAFEKKMGIKDPDGKLSKQEMELLHKEAEKSRAMGKGKQAEAGKEGAAVPSAERATPSAGIDGPENITGREAATAIRGAGIGGKDLQGLDMRLSEATGMRVENAQQRADALEKYLDTSVGELTINGQKVPAQQAKAILGNAGNGQRQAQAAAAVMKAIDDRLEDQLGDKVHARGTGSGPRGFDPDHKLMDEITGALGGGAKRPRYESKDMGGTVGEVAAAVQQVAKIGRQFGI